MSMLIQFLFNNLRERSTKWFAGRPVDSGGFEEEGRRSREAVKEEGSGGGGREGGALNQLNLFEPPPRHILLLLHVVCLRLSCRSGERRVPWTYLLDPSLVRS